MSRIITGKLRLKCAGLDPAQVIEAAVDTLRPALDGKEIRLELALSPEPLPVSGDPNRLQQVIWNLLSNAVKFTPARRPRRGPPGARRQPRRDPGQR